MPTSHRRDGAHINGITRHVAFQPRSIERGALHVSNRSGLLCIGSLRRPYAYLIRRVSSLIFLTAAWQILVMTKILSPLFVASPSTVVQEFGALWTSGIYQADVLSSLARIIVGFLTGSGVGIIAAYVLARYPIVEDFFDWVLQAARFISPLALVPLTVLWLGTGEEQKYFLIALTVFFPVMINTYGAVRSIPNQILRGAQTLNCHGAWRQFRYVVLPMSGPSVFNALRIGMAMAFLVIVAAEMIGATNGIGYLILIEGQELNTPAVFVGIVTVGILGASFDRLLVFMKRRFCPWHVETRAR